MLAQKLPARIIIFTVAVYFGASSSARPQVPLPKPSADTDLAWVDAHECQLTTHLVNIHTALFSSTGSLLATAGTRDTLKLWDSKTGVEWLKIDVKYLRSISFSPEGNAIAVCDGIGALSFWNILEKKKTSCFLTNLLDTTKEPVWSTDFSPDGKTIATFHEEVRVVAQKNQFVIHVWDRRQSKLIGSLRASNLCRPIYSSDDQSLTTSCQENGRYIVFSWNPSMKKKVVITEEREHVSPVVYSPDGSILLLEKSPAFCLLEKSKEGNQWKNHSLSDRLKTSSVICFSPDGKDLAATNKDNNIEIIELRTGKTKHILRSHNARIVNLSYSPDGKKLASVSGKMDRLPNQVIVWEINEELPAFRLRDQCPIPTSLGFGTGNKTLFIQSIDFASPWSPSNILALDCESGKLKGHAIGAPWSLESMIVSEQLILEKSDFPGSMKKANCLSAKFVDQRPFRDLETSNNISCMAATLDGTIVAWANGGIVSIWDVALEKVIKKIKLDSDIQTVVFSPDGKTIAAADERGVVAMWETRSGKKCGSFHAREQVLRVAFSTDGTEVATFSKDITGSYLSFWDFRTGKETGEPIELENQNPVLFQYSKNTKMLVVVYQDSLIETYERLTLRRSARQPAGQIGTRCAALSPNGEWIATGMDKGQVLVFELATGKEVRSINLNDKLQNSDPR